MTPRELLGDKWICFPQPGREYLEAVNSWRTPRGVGHGCNNGSWYSPTASQKNRADATAASRHTDAQLCISSPNQTSPFKSGRPWSSWQWGKMLLVTGTGYHVPAQGGVAVSEACQTRSCRWSLRLCCLQCRAMLHKPKPHLCTHFVAARVALAGTKSLLCMSLHTPRSSRAINPMGRWAL